MTTFFYGDIWKPEDTITDPKTKAKVDPTTVTAKVTAGDGTITEPAVTKLEVGVYVCSVPLDAAHAPDPTKSSKWHVVFTGTGTYAGAKPETITVQPV